MSNTFNDRCKILNKWLGIRDEVLYLKNTIESLPYNTPAGERVYHYLSEKIEEKRHELDVMQRETENPWLADVLKALHKGTEL